MTTPAAYRLYVHSMGALVNVWSIELCVRDTGVLGLHRQMYMNLYKCTGRCSRRQGVRGGPWRGWQTYSTTSFAMLTSPRQMLQLHCTWQQCYSGSSVGNAFQPSSTHPQVCTQHHNNTVHDQLSRAEGTQHGSWSFRSR